MMRAFAITSVLLLAPTAYAQDENQPPAQAPAPAPAPATAQATGGAGDYMGPELNRPLALKQGGIEGEFGLLINRFSTTFTDPVSGTSTTVSSTGESLGFAGRYGIMPNLNAGAELAFELNPDANFSLFLVNALYEFMPGSMMMGAGRVDLGVSHASGSTQFDLGLGVPFKYMLSPMLAFISGSQYAITTFGLTNTSDILFFQFGDATVVNLNIPVGVLVQLSPMFAAQFRTGFSLLHQGDATLKAVPINIDLIGNLNVNGIGIDPFFTFNIAGDTDDYTAFMTFLIGARVHL